MASIQQKITLPFAIFPQRSAQVLQRPLQWFAMPARRRIPLLIGLVLLCWSLTASAKVVISEVQWAGSDLSTADEWVEVACVEGADPPSLLSELWRAGGTEEGCDIGRWTLTSINSKNEEVILLRFATGAVIGSGKFMVIANAGASASRLLNEPWIHTSAISLPNTKLLLRLRTATGMLVDAVDDGVGAPFAGLSKIKAGSGSGLGSGRLIWASMERVNLSASGQLKTNWRNATTFIGFDDGAPVFGTPGYRNNSGASRDITPPIDVSDLEAWTQSGALHVLWKPSTSLDLRFQDISISVWSGSGSVSGTGRSIRFPSTASGWALSECRAASGVIIEPICMSGAMVRLQSTDLLQNISTGSTTRVQPYRKIKIIEQNISSTPTCPWFDASINLQSGSPIAEGKVTVNVQATSTGVTISKLRCFFDFSDGFRPESCNPPAHTFTEPGIHSITLLAVNQCGSTVTRRMDVEVLQEGAEEPDGTEETEERCLVGSGGALSLKSLIISEVFPNPSDEEESLEWVELQNISTDPLPLCGWMLADTAGMKKPYTLSGADIAPGGFLVLSRPQTKIALNNDTESLSILRRAGSGNVVVQKLAYSRAPEDKSFAIDRNNIYHWAPTVTPGRENILPEVAYGLRADPPSGLLHAGSGVQLKIVAVSSDSSVDVTGTNVQFFLSIGSDAFMASSGSFIVDADTKIRAYAQIGDDGLGTPVIEEQYEVIRDRYKESVFISEISPKSGVCLKNSSVPSGSSGSSVHSVCPEWIELHNPAPHSVSLFGWQIDDSAYGGSKKVFIPFGFHMGSGSYVVLSGSLLDISLNDDGDDVRLIDPAGLVHDVISYPKLKKGQTYGRAPGQCVMLPSPLSHNACLSLSRSSKSSSSSKKVVSSTFAKISRGALTEGQSSLFAEQTLRQGTLIGDVTASAGSSRVFDESVVIVIVLTLSAAASYGFIMRK